MAEEESLFTKITGYDDVGDMFDGGGQGGSGDQFYGGSNEEYQNLTGDDGSNDSNFIEKFGNTVTNDFNINYQNDNNNNDTGGNNGGGSSTTATETTEETEPETPPMDSATLLQMATDVGLIKSNEEAEALIADPQKFLADRNMTLQDGLTLINAQAQGVALDPSDPRYGLGSNVNINANTVASTERATAPSGLNPQSYTASTVTDRITNPIYGVDTATGSIDKDNLIDADEIQIDMTGASTGINRDGSINYTGGALNDVALQNISQIIDTSTVQGKLLAQELGEGNYVDKKATVAGQTEILTKQFVGADGQPRIPTWAAPLYRELSRTMTFKGMTGTAATAAMAQAMMEATVGMAEKDAEFFKTLTIKNLDNRQQQVLNKANVLAQFDTSNLSAREAAAVNNAKAFLQMDLTNLTNEQQSAVIDAQARTQALFEDQQSINAQRLFTAENVNDFTKFYDQLSANISLFNAEQVNAMRKFNTGEMNDIAEFNATMEDSRQKFYANMQYQIDTANAKWRQTVELSNNKLLFDAAATDVKNMLSITQEAQNQIWDRVDSMLDMLWKSSENEANRDMEILKSTIMAQANSKGGGIFSIFGDIASAVAVKMITSSDIRLKDDIELLHTLPNGIKVYTWQWNKTAQDLGLATSAPVGVLAQELQKTHPEAVLEGSDGYLRVNYGAIV
tara:strand:+ start:4 stop:2046 length:2043 start_codon:yes stop_codon:yes gene_type:complete